MGCSASCAAHEDHDPPPPSGGLLEAGHGGRADEVRAAMRPRLTVFHNNGVARVQWCTPAEARWAELEPVEFLDPSEKREARFVVSRAAFGLPERVPFKVSSLVLLVDAPGWASCLPMALAHVVVPELWGASLRLEGAAIDALLAHSGAVPVTRHGHQHAVQLPVDNRTRTLAPGVEMEVRAAAARAGVTLRLAACAMVGAPAACDDGDVGAPPPGGMRRTSGFASVPAPPPGACSVVVPLTETLRERARVSLGSGSMPCLLRALLVAVPAGEGRVARLELLLDGRAVLRVPAAVAAMEFEAWVHLGGGRSIESDNNYARYCLALGQFQCRMEDVLSLCGELDLTAPGVLERRIELRIVYYGPDGAPPVANGRDVPQNVFVQACLVL